MKNLCHECNAKYPDYHPISYALGQCDECNLWLGVANCEYKPEIIKDIMDLFGDLTPPK